MSIALALTLFSSISYAQSTIQQDKYEKFLPIIEKGTLAQKDSLLQVLTEEIKTYKKESEYASALDIIYALGKEEQAKALETNIIKKFPKGSLARNAYMTEVYYKTENADDKKKVYNFLTKKWPIKSFPGEELSYDYALADLAQSYANEGKPKEAKYYLEQMKERFWRGNGYLPVGQTFLSSGDTTNAEPLLKIAMEDSYYFLTLPEAQKDNKARFAAQGYASSMSAYVDILVARGNYKDALGYIENALKAAPEQADKLAMVYYKSLNATGRKLEAYNILTKLYSEGEFKIEGDLHKLYVELNGSEKGYDMLKASLKETLALNIRKHIKEMEVFKPAPNFELLNLKGEKVSLESLKGKVIVLDFWATWCQPCKNSFPGMKAAQEMYSADNDVQFLFINTWERDKDYKANVADFLSKNNYPFEVLFDDQKDPQTGLVLAGKFGVQGIPAKFVIDREGNIRYSLTGSTPNVDYIKMEMKELIESAKISHKN